MEGNPLDFAGDAAAKFCSQCGRPAGGRFCSGCGQALAAPATEAEIVGWRDEVRFDVLVRVPEVRRRVERNAALAKRKLTGEEILSFAGSALSLGVPLDKLAGYVQPMYASWGVKTGKSRHEQVAVPVGEAIVRVLCSFARDGQTLQDVQQADDGCVLTATLPSDLFALEGRMIVGVRSGAGVTRVDAETVIEGQWIDWGKSRRRIDKLFGELRAAA